MTRRATTVAVSLWTLTVALVATTLVLIAGPGVRRRGRQPAELGGRRHHPSRGRAVPAGPPLHQAAVDRRFNRRRADAAKLVGTDGSRRRPAAHGVTGGVPTDCGHRTGSPPWRNTRSLELLGISIAYPTHSFHLTLPASQSVASSGPATGVGRSAGVPS
jgi:hypothetical protein